MGRTEDGNVPAQVAILGWGNGAFEKVFIAGGTVSRRVVRNLEAREGTHQSPDDIGRLDRPAGGCVFESE